MQVKQIYELMNNVTSEILGSTEIITEDLSNVVDLGVQIFDNTTVDNYVKSLLNHIGKVVFVNRPYNGNTPSVLMDGWEFGSVLEKIHADIPLATENETWELEDGTSYDPNIFYKPSATAKFFNSKVTFEVPISITDRQVKESFSSAEQLNGFLSMIYDAVDKAMTIKIDALVMRTINNFIGETLFAEYGGVGYNTKSTVKAVNLLYLYNQRYGTNITAEEAKTTPEFIRFAAYEMGITKDRLSSISTLFNIGAKPRFTSGDYLHTILLSEFAKAADVYLQSDVYHNDLVKLPNTEIVPFWQASGETYAFADTSKINIKTASGNNIECGGILGVMFDRDALGVCNKDRRVTTQWNAKAEFTNNWFKFDASYFNDTNENFVVFFVA